jgi:hypothetical protein
MIAASGPGRSGTARYPRLSWLQCELAVVLTDRVAALRRREDPAMEFYQRQLEQSQPGLLVVLGRLSHSSCQFDDQGEIAII